MFSFAKSFQNKSQRKEHCNSLLYILLVCEEVRFLAYLWSAKKGLSVVKYFAKKKKIEQHFFYLKNNSKQSLLALCCFQTVKVSAVQRFPQEDLGSNKFVW